MAWAFVSRLNSQMLWVPRTMEEPWRSIAGQLRIDATDIATTLASLSLEGVSAVRRRPPPVTRSVLQIIGRYAWYDTTLARTELGWSPRPLRETLEDTVRSLRER